MKIFLDEEINKDHHKPNKNDAEISHWRLTPRIKGMMTPT